LLDGNTEQGLQVHSRHGYIAPQNVADVKKIQRLAEARFLRSNEDRLLSDDLSVTLIGYEI
jgi:hypothetical protein